MSQGPKSRTELDFLTAVERGEIVSQMTLSKRLNIAVGLINAILRRAMHKGYVKVKQAPYKRYAYYLTPKGFAEKSRLVTEYLEDSLSFFRTARNQYVELFQAARAAGVEQIVLVGGGELAEIAVLAASAEGITLLAVIDPESNQEKLHGVPIRARLADIADVQGVVITDAKAPQKTYEALREAAPALQLFAPPLLRVTPDRAALAEQAADAEAAE